MGSIREAMIEHRMVTGLRLGNGANDHITRKHWLDELRNCMYQIPDRELVSFLRTHTIEAERLRVCQRIARDEERQESKT